VEPWPSIGERAMLDSNLAHDLMKFRISFHNQYQSLKEEDY